jgi:hypothetical protein
MISDCCADVPLRHCHCDVDTVVTRVPKPMLEQDVEMLLGRLALLARHGCQRLLGRDFSDEEKATLSRGLSDLVFAPNLQSHHDPTLEVVRSYGL